MSKYKFNFFLFIAGFFLSTLVNAKESNRKADFRLVVTGDIQGIHDGYEAFYHSPLFRLGNVADDKLGAFIIEDAALDAYYFDGGIFFSLDKIDESELLKACDSNKKSDSKTIQGLMGSQVHGFAFTDKNSPYSFNNNFLRRELSGIYSQFSYENCLVDSKTIFAFDVTGARGKIKWPKTKQDLTPIKVVIGHHTKANQKFVFVPRQISSTPRVFGIVDQLLKGSNQIPTRYLDMGNALVKSSDESLAAAKQMSSLLMARNPVVLGAGRYDFSVLFKDKMFLEKSPYVIALEGNDILQSRVAQLGKHQIQFSALGDISSTAFWFLPREVSSLNIEKSIQKAQANSNNVDVVIGLTDNVNSANVAISSPVFDAVLSLVSGKRGVLPARDDIYLERNYKEGVGSVAPLIRISSADVTEILVWIDELGRVSHLKIARHAVLGDERNAEDAQKLLQDNWQNNSALLGLPENKSGTVLKPWTQEKLDEILGNVLLEKDKKTELAIIEKTALSTPIYSNLPFRLALSLLERPGKAIWLNLQGKYVKRILKASKQNQFGLPISVIGGNINELTISKRQISDVEYYRVVVTEKVLLAIDAFMSREGLFAADILSSGFVLTALQEGGKDTLKILGELRKWQSKDDPQVGDKSQMIERSPPVVEVVHQALIEGISLQEAEEFFKISKGQRKPTFVFEISDLDVGLKYSKTDDVLGSWQNEIKNGTAAGFTENRLFTDNYLQMLLYVKTGLKYYGSWLETEFSFSEKFFQPYSEAQSKIDDITRRYSGDELKKALRGYLGSNRPVKDATKLNAELRLPFDRILVRPFLPELGLGALMIATYETQIWPNSLMTSISSQYWPSRVNDGRLFLGLGSKPKSIFNSINLGAVLGYDFNRVPIQAFALGIEAAVVGKWRLGVVNVGLDTSLRQMFPVVKPETDRMGLIWLVDGKVELPIYGGLSLSVLVNWTIGARMSEPLKLGTNTILGLALSYGGNFKWLL